MKRFFVVCAALGCASLASAQTPPAAPAPPATSAPPTAQPSPAQPSPAQPPLPQPTAATSAPAPVPPQPAAPTPAPTAVPSQPSAATPATEPQPSAASASEPRDASALDIEGLTVQPNGLTTEDTVRRALAASSTAAEKQADIDAANARIRSTIVQFVPKLSLKASYTRLSPIDAELGGALVGARSVGPLLAEDCDMGTCVVDSAGDPVAAAEFSFPSVEDNYAITASLAIPLSDYLLRLSDANAGAEASREAARFALTAAESKVRTDARVLYYNWLRAHAQTFIAANAIERVRARLEDARAAVAVGKLANADLLRIEALVANAEAAHKGADAMRMLIGAQLAIIMRDESGGEYTIGSTLPLLDAEELPPEGVRKMTGEALQERLELRAVDKAISALDYGRDAVRAGGYPRVDAVGDVTYGNPNPRYFPPAAEWNASWTVGVVASWNVEAPWAAGAQADELAAQTAGLRAQRAGLEAAIVNEVVTAQAGVIQARAALTASQTSVRAFEEAYRVATDLFRVGRGTTSDLVDAESDLLGAKLQAMNARIDLTIAVTRLEHAVGREARNYKGAQASR